MSHDLPAEILARLDALSSGQQALAPKLAKISSTYRTGGASATVIRDPADALAYALARMPATYAACHAVFNAVAARLGDVAPTSLVDLGAGTGAASLAARMTWPGLGPPHLVDQPGPLADLAKTLIAPATFQSANLAQATKVASADLVIASYVLAELNPTAQTLLAKTAAHATGKVIVVIEPGTPDGHRRILAARQILIDQGLSVIAPCPGACPCPLDHCRFVVRFNRSRRHRQLKDAVTPFEDESFSYVAACKPGLGEPTQARIVAPVDASKVGLTLSLCTETGLERRVIPARDKVRYRHYRRARWGDGIDDDAP